MTFRPVYSAVGKSKYSRVQFKTDKPSNTQTQFKDMCDLNHLVKSALKTGYMPQSNKIPIFGEDFSHLSLTEAVNVVEVAVPAASAKSRYLTSVLRPRAFLRYAVATSAPGAAKALAMAYMDLPPYDDADRKPDGFRR